VTGVQTCALPIWRALNRAKRLVGWPLTIAFDSVAIARKPADTTTT
jgi:hypothetical protein